jgi:pimeloyl-ACP methyl ester carboxylesterase
MKTIPFRIDVKQSDLDYLRSRIINARWPDSPGNSEWTMGTGYAFMRNLARHWSLLYDWRRHEAELNAHPQFIADVDGTDVHFTHVRGRGTNPTPLLLIHSFPDSFYRFYPAIPMLTDPAAHGGDAARSFDLIIPSLPGFGFSEKKAMSVDPTADLLARLMVGLGYRRYLAGGGDGPIPIAMARRHAAEVRGIYCVDVGYPDGGVDPSTLSPPEREFAQWVQGWWMRDGAFNLLQSTQPQSLSFALQDSPLGLAAWLLILFASGAPYALADRFSLDGLITNFMIYWVSGTITSAMRTYRENALAVAGNPGAAPPPRSDVPAAVARMPLDAPMPREWAERNVNLVQWSELPKGGHWSSWEVPDDFARDLRSFLGRLG